MNWSDNINTICETNLIVLPGQDNVAGNYSKGDLAYMVIGDKFTFDFALPQGMVDAYREDNDHDIRQWCVYAYPEGYPNGILFPLCHDEQDRLTRIELMAGEDGWEK